MCLQGGNPPGFTGSGSFDMITWSSNHCIQDLVRPTSRAGVDREDVDDSDNTLKKKIRQNQLMQYNYILVVGKEEVEKPASMFCFPCSISVSLALPLHPPLPSSRLRSFIVCLCWLQDKIDVNAAGPHIRVCSGARDQICARVHGTAWKRSRELSVTRGSVFNHFARWRLRLFLLRVNVAIDNHLSCCVQAGTSGANRSYLYMYTFQSE
eukprot:753428-Hanusia_phi.AAC.3